MKKQRPSWTKRIGIGKKVAAHGDRQ